MQTSVKFVTLLLCGCGAFPGVADSQTAESAATASKEASPDPDIGDIVVTANKREQNINKVGLTISALSSDALAKQRVSTLSDIAQAVPGLTFNTSASNSPIFTLRGVGFQESSLAAYPTTSVYIDEVPLPFPVLTTQTAFDLERIEVLKGPQGTLFGQNSTGGAINYIAAKPTNSLEAGGDISYGRFNTVDANAHLSGPLSETLRGRLAFHAVHGDAWQKSYTRDDKTGKTESYAGRLLLDWEATEGLKLSLNVNGWVDKSDPQAFQYVAFYPQQPTSPYLPVTAAYPFAPSNPRAADWTLDSYPGQPGFPGNGRYSPRANNRFYQSALRADLDLTDAITLTSITSYVDYKQRQTVDGDGLSLNTFDLALNNGRIKSFSQELRISNNSSSELHWVVGGNYERSNVSQHDQLTYIDATTAPLFNIVGSFADSVQKMRNYAAFGNVEYELNSKLTFKAGARYTKADRSNRECGLDQGDGLINALYDSFHTLFGVIQAPLQQGDCVTLNAITRRSEATIGQLNEDNISWRAGLDYHASRDLLLYTNVSKGYKAGSFPNLAGSTSFAFRPVTQESVLAYEAGFKAQLLDRTLSINGAGFYYDYRNKQLKSKYTDPIFGTLDLLQNVPKSRIYGAELELNARPIQGLSIAGSFAYTNSKVLRYTGENFLGSAQDFSGTPLPYTPKYQVGVNADYKWDVGSIAPFLGASVTMRSDTFAALGGRNYQAPTAGIRYPFDVEGYALLDLRAGIESGDGRWRAMIWGKNVTNSYYWTNVINAFDTVARIAGRPATYGLTLGYNFR